MEPTQVHTTARMNSPADTSSRVHPVEGEAGIPVRAVWSTAPEAPERSARFATPMTMAAILAARDS